MAQLVYVSYYKKPLYTMAQATTYKDVLLHRRYMSYRMSPLGFEPRTHGLKGTILEIRGNTLGMKLSDKDKVELCLMRREYSPA
jgi:hypothetical protein